MERQQSCAGYLQHKSFPSTPFHQSQPSMGTICFEAQTGHEVNLGMV